MHDIRFRAWDKDKQEMFDWGFTEDGLYPRDFFNNDGYEVMQFTGFYDKNGTEVYEGDVIEFPFLGGLHREKIEEHNHDGHEYCWWLSLPWNRVFTVIGNIYENPELAGNTL